MYLRSIVPIPLVGVTRSLTLSLIYATQECVLLVCSSLCQWPTRARSVSRDIDGRRGDATALEVGEVLLCRLLAALHHLGPKVGVAESVEVGAQDDWVGQLVTCAGADALQVGNHERT